MYGNLIYLNQNLVNNFLTTAEEVTEKIHRINENLGKSYQEILAETRKKNTPPIREEKSYWEIRLEKLKKRLQAEQEFFLEQQQLKDTGERLAQRRAISAAQTGLDDPVKPQLPVTGVPASILLELLG